MIETPTLDLAELERLKKTATERVLQELLRQYKRRPDWDDAKDVIEGLDCGALVKAALTADAPALIAAAKERDELQAELDQMDGVHLRAQLAERENSDLRALLVQAGAELKMHACKCSPDDPCQNGTGCAGMTAQTLAAAITRATQTDIYKGKTI